MTSRLASRTIASGAASRPVKARVGAVIASLAAGIDQEPDEQVRDLVAGGAVGAPVRRQRLVGREDLLDQQLDRPRRRGAQAPQVRLRVAQPVDVVDPQPVDDALLDQVEHQPRASPRTPPGPPPAARRGR